MIAFAKEAQRQDIINIWQTSFPDDSKEFVDMYFAEKYKKENTLVYLFDNKLVSCLQMLPYSIMFYNNTCKTSYISGAATLPDYKNRGIMGKLLSQSFLEMKKRGDIFTILIPQELWLVEFYQKYGYTLCFEASSSNVYDCTACFSDIFDFLELDHTHTKEVMARILDVEKTLQIYASYYDDLQISIKVNDKQIEENNGIFCLHNGHCCPKPDKDFDMEININLLAGLLFGYQTNNLFSFSPLSNNISKRLYESD